MKTIRPKPNDRWEQFEKAVREGWFPDNVRVILSKQWLGGELWHNMFAARACMLEYALELEAKIRDGGLASEKKAAFILAFGGAGFAGVRTVLRTSSPSTAAARIVRTIRWPRLKRLWCKFEVEQYSVGLARSIEKDPC